MHQTKAFTLAEVLIALVVIGIVAAITLTTVMPNIQERANSQRQANIVYKVTQATNLMKANGAMVDGFKSTDAFVDELQKYLKIMKRCDSEHIADCWPTKKVRTSDGKEYDVAEAKLRKDLGFKNSKTNKNVGIILADGATIIMTYNPEATELKIGDPITTYTTELPVGGKFQTFLDYTSNTTAGLAFVMDVNGKKGPNSETIKEKKYDIRNFNSAAFGSCGGTKFNNQCFESIDSYDSVDCSNTSYGGDGWGTGDLIHPENATFCGQYRGYSGHNGVDYWAGARKACIDRGMELADYDVLLNLCRSTMETQEIATGLYWANKDNGPQYSYLVDFYNNNMNCYATTSANKNERNNVHKVLCVDN